VDAEVNPALHNDDEVPGKQAYRQRVLDSWSRNLGFSRRGRKEAKIGCLRYVDA